MILSHPWKYLEIDTFVYNKLILYRLYFRNCTFLILLKITVNMRQLWLSSSAYLIWEYFLTSNNSAKTENLSKSFYWPRDQPFDIYHPNLRIRSSVREELFFLKCTHFGPCYLVQDILPIMYQILHNSYNISQGLKNQLG